MFGFLNICKPKGLTSFDVIRVLRKVLKIKQIGHTGTLDPLAQGVLPICIGKSTKLIDYLQEDKAYIASLKLGFVSDTYDTEGEIREFSGKKVSKEEFEAALNDFRGEIEQAVPIYSAVSVDGQRLYDLARKGKTVENLPERTVNITKCELLEFSPAEQSAKIEIHCSKGTYIRSIIHDLGQKLGSGALMDGLVRTKSGKFEISNSVPLDKIQSPSDVERYLINPVDVLSYNCAELSDDELEKIKVGQQIKNRGFSDNEVLLLTHKGDLASIARAQGESIKVIKVFV